MKVLWSTCKARLATIWLGGAAVLFAWLLVQTFSGKYGPEVKTVWEWFLPSISPTLLLIVGVLAREATTDAGADQYIGALFYRVSVGLSVLYLATLAATILYSPSGGVERMRQTAIFLGPFQGLVSLALGAVFAEKREAAKQATA